MTANKAASEVRHEILRKMKELENEPIETFTRWAKLKEYIKGMAKRASKKEGGLGRK